MQDNFKQAPVVLVTSEHIRTGKEYDAALIWAEDVTKDSFKVCLRELQNFDGKHEDINVVREKYCILDFFFYMDKIYKGTGLSLFSVCVAKA